MKDIVRIYVDTNVLINYCAGQQNDLVTLNYIFSKRRKEVLFTSSLTIVQTITKLQSRGKGRIPFSNEKTKAELEKIIDKFTVLDLSLSEIKLGLNAQNKDIEDNVHYYLSKKAKCNAVLTNM